MIDTTKALLTSAITLSEFFRLYQALEDSLPEDLEYIKNHITKTKIKGYTEVLALDRNGLMIQCSIKPNVFADSQEYTFTELAFLLDRYVLSINDEERFKWYFLRNEKCNRVKLDGPETASEEQIKAMMNQTIHVK